MIWARALAYITGTVDQELLLRNEYLAAENRILRAQIKGRLLLSDAEKATLAEIAHRLGRKALEELTAVAKPDTLLAWYRKLIANKFDGSSFRKSWGRPRVDEETERFVVRMAKENPGWGYDRIAGAMANLGFRLSDQTVGNILRRNDIPPAPKRKHETSWKDFIRVHKAVLAATDFFTVEVLTLRGLMTYYVLFFIHLDSRRICLAGVTRHPDQEWMEQMARNVTMEDSGFLITRRYLLHDRDSKYCSSFRQVIEAGGVKTLTLPPRSPNLNAYAERWVRSVKEECLAKLILLGEDSLRRALRDYEAHYHEERNHQGKDNLLLFPLPTPERHGEPNTVRCRERLGGLLRYYERQAA
jgi:transposase InsO family protein